MKIIQIINARNTMYLYGLGDDGNVYFVKVPDDIDEMHNPFKKKLDTKWELYIENEQSN